MIPINKCRFILAASGLVLGFFSSYAQHIEKPAALKTATTFAIVVDDVTLAKARTEITAYKNALEKQGLGTYIVSKKWTKPEEVRDVLQKLSRQKPKLEGAVLVGDIPVVMVMDAQRLTSAYRLDQARFKLKAAVPSDRFYDDFELKFDFIKRDSAKTNQFYYSLSPNSTPKIDLNIYTARIKAPKIKGKDQYELIKAYLNKVVDVKQEQNNLNSLMVYSGIGYASESQTAWASEQVAIREQVPGVFKPGASAKFINSRMPGDLKAGLLAELQREDLDLAIFHQHGESDMQLVSGYPYASFPQPSIENVRRYLRNKIQNASQKKQDVNETKKRFQQTMGVPMAWMDDALADSVVKADSLFEANGNILMEDIDAIRPNARMVILDNCYNGSFHKDDYMSGHYIFGQGKTVVSMANSINVLQDVRTTEGLGLLQLGVRAGNWFKQQAYLETHLIGDPTFAFKNESQTEYNNVIVNSPAGDAIWEQYLKTNDADLQALALSKISGAGNSGNSKLLRDTYYSSPYASTRMQAYKLLAQLNTPEFAQVIKDALNDSYEFLRRRAANQIGDFGSDDMVEALVQSSVADWQSKRVSYNSSTSLSFMDGHQVIAALERIKAKPEYVNTRSADIEKMITRQKSYLAKLKKDGETITDPKATVKERLFDITMLRTYSYHKLIPQAIQVAADKKEDPALRSASVEALGWFPYSYQKNQILDALNKIISDPETTPELKKEASRSKTYLLAYTPFTKDYSLVK